MNEHENLPERRKRGRPSKYTAAIADEICQRLSLGESLRSVCRDEHMPDESTVREWARNPEHDFSPRYIRARETGCYALADETLEIADNGSNDWMVRHSANGDDVTVLNSEHVQRSRLRVDTRKWLLSKMLPAVFGDRIQHAGDAQQPLTVQVVSFSGKTDQREDDD